MIAGNFDGRVVVHVYVHVNVYYKEMLCVLANLSTQVWYASVCIPVSAKISHACTFVKDW